MNNSKEFLYVGYYFDTDNRFILKIGTTNDLARRAQEHNRNYKRAPDYKLPADNNFVYLWSLPLSKYNTLRYEDKNRELWKEREIGIFVRNDRFCCTEIPETVDIVIKKKYSIPVAQLVKQLAIA